MVPFISFRVIRNYSVLPPGRLVGRYRRGKAPLIFNRSRAVFLPNHRFVKNSLPSRQTGNPKDCRLGMYGGNGGIFTAGSLPTRVKMPTLQICRIAVSPVRPRAGETSPGASCGCQPGAAGACPSGSSAGAFPEIACDFRQIWRGWPRRQTLWVCRSGQVAGLTRHKSKIWVGSPAGELAPPSDSNYSVED